jgi:hypothetical protein
MRFLNTNYACGRPLLYLWLLAKWYGTYSAVALNSNSPH